jgi:hypothetical protein
MSYIKRWDVDKIINDLRGAAAQVHSSYNDGFTAWACKEDLLTVKYAIDEMLEGAPYFSHMEDDFHKEKSKEKTWRALNGKV